MRKGTLLVAVLFAAVASSAADAAAKKAAKVDPGLAAQETSMKFIAAAWQPWATTYAKPAPAKKVRVAKKKK